MPGNSHDGDGGEDLAVRMARPELFLPATPPAAASFRAIPKPDIDDDEKLSSFGSCFRPSDDVSAAIAFSNFT